MMQEFYNKALVVFLCLLAASMLMGYVCVNRTYLHLQLVPAGKSEFHWQSEVDSDVREGGSSAIKINDNQFSLSFEFNITQKAQYPFVTTSLVFTDPGGKASLVDLSQYDTISFSAKCSPSNTLTLSVLTFDEKVSVPGDYLTYRASFAFFSCNETWAAVELDLTRLETPQWWFDMFKLDLSKQAYALDRVSKISFSSTFQSPPEVVSNVQLDEIALKGRDWRYMYLLGGLMVGIWRVDR
jgi:hypothetical protein